MGYERKRSKLALLNNWLQQPGTQFSSVANFPPQMLPAGTTNTDHGFNLCGFQQGTDLKKPPSVLRLYSYDEWPFVLSNDDSASCQKWCVRVSGQGYA